jgi:hypothetical protein
MFFFQELARYQWLIKAKKSLDQIKFYHEATLKKPKEEEAEKKPKKEEEEEADDEEPPEAEHQQQKETTRERGQRVDLPRLRVRNLHTLFGQMAQSSFDLEKPIYLSETDCRLRSMVQHLPPGCHFHPAVGSPVCPGLGQRCGGL